MIQAAKTPKSKIFSHLFVNMCVVVYSLILHLLLCFSWLSKLLRLIPMYAVKFRTYPCRRRTYKSNKISTTHINSWCLYNLGRKHVYSPYDGHTSGKKKCIVLRNFVCKYQSLVEKQWKKKENVRILQKRT